MKTLTIFLVVLATSISCRSIVPLKLTTHKTVNTDTIILRQICGYCNSSVYQRNPAIKLCFCIDIFEPQNVQDSTKYNQFVSAITYAKHLIIENPSASIDKIPFKGFKSLETLFIFGNDYNTDGLSSLPKELLEIESLKAIEFDGVRFDKKELENIKQKYPHIKIIGKIDEY